MHNTREGASSASLSLSLSSTTSNVKNRQRKYSHSYFWLLCGDIIIDVRAIYSLFRYKVFIISTKLTSWDHYRCNSNCIKKYSSVKKKKIHKRVASIRSEIEWIFLIICQKGCFYLDGNRTRVPYIYNLK